MSDDASRTGATRRLGAWCAGLRYEAIPAKVAEHAKLCLLDTVGCALYASTLPWTRIVYDYAAAQTTAGKATLWGRADRCTAGDAALANGTAAHGYEIDDVHLRSLIHPGTVVMPAVLAVAETHGTTGKDVIAAIVAGYEAGLRVGIAAGIPHQLKGYHPTGTIGCVASAAGAARALGLSPEQSVHAIAVGATQASGLYSAVRSGAMVKRMHAGRAAQAGVLGALVAARGYTGSDEVLETPFAGFMSTLGSAVDINEQCADLGERWETIEVGFKVYAACASAHTTIDAVRAVRERGVRADNMKSMTVHMSKSAMNNVAFEYRPSTAVAAQMNGYYAAGVTLTDGDAFIDQYAEGRLADPRTLDVIRRINIVHDPKIDEGGAATRHSVWLEATCNDGRVEKVVIDQRRGSSKYPLSAAEIERKFARTAGEVLPAAAVEQVRESIMNLDAAADVRGLMRMLSAARAA